MAIYTGAMHVADALAACLTSDRPDGLWPTVVVDERGVALGLAYSSAESLRVAIDERRGVYWSRSRGLWRKGESSGAVQELLRIDRDCDRDALRFTVRQRGGGFCHTGSATCFGAARGLTRLEGTIASAGARNGSYAARLLADPALLASKIAEEGRELSAASTRDEVIHEAADVLYFAAVKLASHGAGLGDVERELDRRARRITRRPGNAKPEVLP